MTLTNVLFGTFALREHQAHILTVTNASFDSQYLRTTPRNLKGLEAIEMKACAERALVPWSFPLKFRK